MLNFRGVNGWKKKRRTLATGSGPPRRSQKPSLKKIKNKPEKKEAGNFGHHEREINSGKGDSELGKSITFLVGGKRIRKVDGH